jgi:hypothetical protein
MPVKKLLHEMPVLKWPSRDCKPAIEVNIDFIQLCEKCNLDYFSDRDDLDEYLATGLENTKCGPISFLRYRGAPNKAVIVFVDWNASPSAVAELLVNEYKFESDSFLWIAEK